MDHPFHQFIHLRVGYGGPYMTNVGTRQVLPNPPATEITFGTHDDGIHGLASALRSGKSFYQGLICHVSNRNKVNKTRAVIFTHRQK